MYNFDDNKDPVDLLVELRFVVSSLIDHGNNLLAAYDSCRSVLNHICDKEEKEIRRMGRDYSIILRRIDILKIDELDSDGDEAIMALVQIKNMVNTYIKLNTEDSECRARMLISLSDCMD